MAKALPSDMEAMLNLVRIFDAVSRENFPPLPNGEWTEDDPAYFDPDEVVHLRAFHDRVMACVNASPGCENRVIWGFQCVLDNNVFDPAADTLEWHPDLREAISLRELKAPETSTPAATVTPSETLIEYEEGYHR